MGKKAKARPGDGPPLTAEELHELDSFTAGDFEWIDDPRRVAANAAPASGIPRGHATRSLRQLEVVLLPAITAARELFRAIARGQAHPPPDPATSSIFSDYRHYLQELQANVEAGGEQPDEAIREYIACIGQVLACFDALLRGEGVSRLEALKADAWLRDVPGETLLFN